MEAQYIFKQYYESKNSKKKGFEALSAACVYLACRIKNIPRSSKGKRLINYSTFTGH